MQEEALLAYRWALMHINSYYLDAAPETRPEAHVAYHRLHAAKMLLFGAFLGDGGIRLTNNAAERALRGLVLGGNSGLFAGSDRGEDRAARIYNMIVSAKLKEIAPQAWRADGFARIASLP